MITWRDNGHRRRELSALIIRQIFWLVRDWFKRVTWPNIPQLKLRNIREYSQIFKTARVAKKIWRIINTIAAIWRENMLGYLSLEMICSEKRTVFRERSSRKTVSFSEQIMSADKYLNIFLRQMEAIVYIFIISHNKDCSIGLTQVSLKNPLRAL